MKDPCVLRVILLCYRMPRCSVEMERSGSIYTATRLGVKSMMYGSSDAERKGEVMHIITTDGLRALRRQRPSQIQFVSTNGYVTSVDATVLHLFRSTVRDEALRPHRHRKKSNMLQNECVVMRHHLPSAAMIPPIMMQQ
jgi:hypothetical protein